MFAGACRDAPTAPQPLSPEAPRFDVGDQIECIVWVDGCPDVPVSGGGGGGGTGQADPVDTGNENVNWWPRSVFLVYTSPYDGSTMTGWASYSYSGSGYGFYTFSTTSFSTYAHETGGFRMTIAELITLTVVGDSSIDVSWVSSHSAGAQ
jgi:hypothetical protein